jgi:hypothetical protein
MTRGYPTSDHESARRLETQLDPSLTPGFVVVGVR